MTPMQSRTNKLVLVLLCCLAFAGFAGLGLCEGGGGGSGKRPMMQIRPPMAPVAQGAIPDQTLIEGATETLDVEPYFTDPDDDSLTYSVDVPSGASAATVTVSGSMVTIRGVAAGTARVRVTAADPGGLTAEQDFDVRVEAVVEIPPPVVSPPVTPPPVVSPPVGSRPEWNTIPSQRVAEGASIILNLGTYSMDPDGDSLTYGIVSVVRVSGDSLAVDVRRSGSMLTIDGLVAGEARVVVRVTDTGGLSADPDQEFTVTVTPNTQ